MIKAFQNEGWLCSLYTPSTKESRTYWWLIGMYGRDARGLGLLLALVQLMAHGCVATAELELNGTRCMVYFCVGRSALLNLQPLARAGNAPQSWREDQSSGLLTCQAPINSPVIAIYYRPSGACCLYPVDQPPTESRMKQPAIVQKVSSASSSHLASGAKPAKLPCQSYTPLTAPTGANVVGAEAFSSEAKGVLAP